MALIYKDGKFSGKIGIELEYEFDNDLVESIAYEYYSEYYDIQEEDYVYDRLMSIRSGISDCISEPIGEVKPDASLLYDGIEFNSIVLESDNLEPLVEQLLEKIDAIEDITVTDGCGMHIHVDRNRMSDLEVYAVMAMMGTSYIRNIIDTLGFRSGNHQWAKEMPTNASDLLHMMLIGKSYTQVTQSSFGTIEFRLFNGTDNVEDVLLAMEFIAFVLELSSRAVKEHIFNPDELVTCCYVDINKYKRIKEKMYVFSN